MIAIIRITQSFFLYSSHILEWVIIMNYLVSSTYNVNYYDYTPLELEFMKKSYELGVTYPFKWYEFINKIVGNRKITYFKDTTMIVTIVDLELGQVKILFELLKEYLKLKLIRKVLYKREFIIVHFYTNKTKDVFEQPNLWISIFSYFMIKNSERYDDINLRGVIHQNGSKELVDLVIVTDEFTFLINSRQPLLGKYEDAISIYLYYELTKDVLVPNLTHKLKFSFDQTTFLYNLEHLVKYELLEFVHK